MNQAIVAVTIGAVAEGLILARAGGAGFRPRSGKRSLVDFAKAGSWKSTANG